MTSEWLPTVCGMCYARCGILVRVENGMITSIESKPNKPPQPSKNFRKSKN